MPANLKEEIRSDECKAMASVQEVLDVIFVFRTKLTSTIQKKTQKTKDKKLPKKKKGNVQCLSKLLPLCL